MFGAAIIVYYHALAWSRKARFYVLRTLGVFIAALFGLLQALLFAAIDDSQGPSLAGTYAFQTFSWVQFTLART